MEGVLLTTADYWEKATGDRVKCLLCPHECTIGLDKKGICGVRTNYKGVLYSLTYGLAVSGHADPIEKKPLYHFHPGTDVYSFGSLGCNLKCSFCQNWSISQKDVPAVDEMFISRYRREPKEAAQEVFDSGCAGVAWTYNEPTIWMEFARDTSKIVKSKGLYSVFVTNGFMNPRPLKDIAPYLDAMNVDVKSFSKGFYHDLCKAKLEPVKRTCELAVKLGIHLEITTLVITDTNDNMEEIKKLCEWVRDSLGPSTVMHFSRYHPDYKFTKPPTPPKTLHKAAKMAKKVGLDHVYIGNMYDEKFLHSYCQKCKKVVVERGPMHVRDNRLKKGKCPHCGSSVMKKY